MCQKVTYTTESLPSLRHAHYSNRWHKDFRSSLLECAGTAANLFGTDTIMQTVVKQTWYVIFPELQEKWKSDSDVIIGVVSGYILAYVYIT